MALSSTNRTLPYRTPVTGHPKIVFFSLENLEPQASPWLNSQMPGALVLLQSLPHFKSDFSFMIHEPLLAG